MVAGFLMLNCALDECCHLRIAAAPCITPSKSWSDCEKRHVRILPSEVSRTRLQLPQKACETGAMIPISPTPSSKVYRVAVSLAAIGGNCTSGRKASSRAFTSSSGRTVSGDQKRPYSSGMNSMNRTMTPSSRENFAKGTSWSSLKPRSNTQFILIWSKPVCLAARTPGYDTVEAYVPQVELARYITELRTATQGLGTYSWRHERFDPVPGKWSAPKAAV